MEGIDKAVAQKPDVILCDILMPHPDGYEVQQRLATTPGTATIPMLAVTALAMVGDTEKILKAGFQGYISKPVDPRDLGRFVKSFIADKKMPPEVGESSTL